MIDLNTRLYRSHAGLSRLTLSLSVRLCFLSVDGLQLSAGDKAVADLAGVALGWRWRLAGPACRQSGGAARARFVF